MKRSLRSASAPKADDPLGGDGDRNLCGNKRAAEGSPERPPSPSDLNKSSSSNAKNASSPQPVKRISTKASQSPAGAAPHTKDGPAAPNMTNAPGGEGEEPLPGEREGQDKGGLSEEQQEQHGTRSQGAEPNPTGVSNTSSSAGPSNLPPPPSDASEASPQAPKEVPSSSVSLAPAPGVTFPAEFPVLRFPDRQTRPVAAGYHWSDGLLSHLEKPDLFKEWIFWCNDEFMVIFDAYPKARVHLLVMPRPNAPATISNHPRAGDSSAATWQGTQQSTSATAPQHSNHFGVEHSNRFGVEHSNRFGAPRESSTGAQGTGWVQAPASGREGLIQEIYSLTRDHLGLLDRLKSVGDWLVQGLSQVHEGRAGVFVGFHGSPSMRPLHMHVISRDMDSECLKKKRHWNSFTSGNLVSVGRVRAEIERHGSFRPELRRGFDAMLDRDLACNRCGVHLATIPALKAHLPQCTRPYPELD
eukprot:jgi/Mesvir1/1632/Mv05068-RA.1